MSTEETRIERAEGAAIDAKVYLNAARAHVKRGTNAGSALALAADSLRESLNHVEIALKHLGPRRRPKPKALPIYYVACSREWFLCRAQNKRAAERDAKREWGWPATEVRLATEEEVAHYRNIRPGDLEADL